MRRIDLLNRLALALLIVAWTVPGSAGARTWTDLDLPVVGDPGAAALKLVTASGARFGYRGGVLRARVIAVRGGAVVRLAQEHRGRPVLGAELAVMVLGGRAISASGELAAITREADGPTLSVAAAEAAVMRAIAGAVASRSQLAFQVRGGEAQPVWVVQATRARPFGSWRVVVDARTAELRETTSQLRGLASANIYAANPKLSSLTKLELQGLESQSELRGVHADVSSCGSSQGKLSCQRYAAPDANGDYLFQPDDPSISDPFSEAHAYYHVDSFHRWLAKRFLFARKGKQVIKVVTNYHTETSSGSTQGLYNAFFGDLDGDGVGDLVFGQGSRDYAYDADVVYHEFTHSAIAETSDFGPVVDELGFNLMPLALGEAFADLFSSSYLDDPNVGDYAGGKSALRSLAGAAVRCPDDLSGEEHQDGLIWGRAAWAVRVAAPTTELFEDVLYKTMVGLGSHATVAEAAQLFEKVAQQTSAPLAQTAGTVFAARGLATCERVVTLIEGKQRSGWTYGTSIGMQAVPAPMQYKIEVPTDATQLQIDVTAVGWHGATPGTIGAFVRKDGTVNFAGSKSVHDILIMNGQTSTMLAVGDAKQPLSPGASYYVLPVNVGVNETLYRISYSLVRAAAPDAGAPPPADRGLPDSQRPDAAAPRVDAGAAAESPATGCGCEAAGGRAAPVGWFVLAALLLGSALRRRRPT